MKKLKERWGIDSNFDLFIVFVVFAITGSCAAKLGSPLLEWAGLNRETTSGWIYWPVRIFSIFPIYQVLLVCFGWLFGKFEFFWAFEKKMLRHLGLGRFLKD